MGFARSQAISIFWGFVFFGFTLCTFFTLPRGAAALCVTFFSPLGVGHSAYGGNLGVGRKKDAI